MDSSNPVHVHSEIGRLRTVVLHRPGKELENLIPEYLGRLLFDDIPYLPEIQREHDVFAQVLRERDIQVLYLGEMATQALHSREVREQFIDQLLIDCSRESPRLCSQLSAYLLDLPTGVMIDKVMTGIRKNELPEIKHTHLYELVDDQYPFYLDPMPNLYFTRDPAASMGHGVSINRMSRQARRRESLFMQYIIQHHPLFEGKNVPAWYNVDMPFSTEGGDQLVLSKEVLAIGISERTQAQAVEALALKLFKANSGFKKVLAIEIPKTRAFMHLDTVFTMVDYNKFTMHAQAVKTNNDMRIFVLEPDDNEGTLHIEKRNNLVETLKEVLHLSEIEMIPCGGSDVIAAAREQWNDGSNTLAISPGAVITYDRNTVSNRLLRERGVEVLEVSSSEMSRGRGGPRCMSMPIVRDDI